MNRLFRCLVFLCDGLFLWAVGVVLAEWEIVCMGYAGA